MESAGLGVSRGGGPSWGAQGLSHQTVLENFTRTPARVLEPKLPFSKFTHTHVHTHAQAP